MFPCSSPREEAGLRWFSALRPSLLQFPSLQQQPRSLLCVPSRPRSFRSLRWSRSLGLQLLSLSSLFLSLLVDFPALLVALGDSTTSFPPRGGGDGAITNSCATCTSVGYG